VLGEVQQWDNSSRVSNFQLLQEFLRFKNRYNMFPVTFPDMEGLLCHILRLCGSCKTHKIEKGYLTLSLDKTEAWANVPHSKRKKQNLETKSLYSILLQTWLRLILKVLHQVFSPLFLRNEVVRKGGNEA
jgi:hypothetical protein